MKRTTFAAIAAIAFVHLSANAMAAEDGHSFNGSQCVSYVGSQAGELNHYPGGVANTSRTATALVTCPISVDSIGDTSGTTRIKVHYTGSGTFSCTFFSMNGHGTVRQSMGANRVNTGWLDIPNITSDDFWGSYAMYCYIPPNGSLNTVWVGERY